MSVRKFKCLLSVGFAVFIMLIIDVFVELCVYTIYTGSGCFFFIKLWKEMNISVVFDFSLLTFLPAQINIVYRVFRGELFLFPSKIYVELTTC